ncbi:hypothetical protein [Aliivibrio fischeri]|uniref:hypothetical protein n=1 Tax=Aliivibrio fischeri TaxID=668 RepID=UPI0007C45EF4|nr:hypothetical protein [Aliivibrio fischeri]
MKLSKSLENSLKKDDLKNVMIGIGEVGLDSIMESGAWRDVPILSSLLGGIKTIGNVRDALFIKKLLSFLTELSEIPIEKRQKMIESIELSEDYQLNVGEKLIYIIERSEDHFSSKIIAIFFAAFINEQITYTQFLRISRIIDNMYLGDFLSFANESSNLNLDPSLANTGLVDLYFDEVVVEDNDDYKRSGKYITSGGELSFEVSDIGAVIRKILRDKN